MANSNAIKTAIGDVLRGVSGVGKVLENDVYVNRDAEIKAHYFVDDKVNAWVIRRAEFRRAVGDDGVVRETMAFTIRGYLSFSEGDQSEATMDSLVNAIFDAFDNDLDLNETVDTIIVDGEIGPQLTESTPVMLVGKLCDKVIIKLKTLTYVQIEE